MITFVSVLTMGLSAFADDFNLYYDAKDGAENTMIEAVSNLQKLTFENGTMVVTRKDGTSTSLSVASINRLFFSTEQAVGIDELTDETAANKKDEVYDITGRKLDIDLKSEKLPSGLYIINGQKTLIK